MPRPTPDQAGILDFWFAPGMERRWFRSTPALDETIRERFEPTWCEAAAGRLDAWAETAPGALALTVVLDQLPLNMFRGEARAFATGDRAVETALRAIGRGLDGELPRDRVAFLYMPLMHSEDIAHQDLAVRLFEAAGLEDNVRFARHHRDLIRCFGRFPHRNAILGRPSTPEELAYLASKDAFTG